VRNKEEEEEENLLRFDFSQTNHSVHLDACGYLHNNCYVIILNKENRMVKNLIPVGFLSWNSSEYKGHTSLLLEEVSVKSILPQISNKISNPFCQVCLAIGILVHCCGGY